MKFQGFLLQLTVALLALGLADGAGFGDRARNYWISHGALMFFSWGFVFPVGILIAVYRKKVGKNGKYFKCFPHFYLPHLFFQVFGGILNILAVGLAARGSYLEYGTGDPFEEVLWDFVPTRTYPNNRHVKLGVATLAILLVQSILGYVHHLIKHYHDEKASRGEAGPWKRWLVPSWAHVILGPCSLAVAFTTIVQGFQIFVHIYFGTDSPPNRKIRFGYAMVGVTCFFFTASYLYSRAMLAYEKYLEMKGMAPATEEEKGEGETDNPKNPSDQEDREDDEEAPAVAEGGTTRHESEGFVRSSAPPTRGNAE